MPGPTLGLQRLRENGHLREACSEMARREEEETPVAARKVLWIMEHSSGLLRWAG